MFGDIKLCPLLVEIHLHLKDSKRKKAQAALPDKNIVIRNALYAELIHLIELFPEEAPAEILREAGDSPCFRGRYDTVLKSLHIKIEDAKGRIPKIEDVQHRQEIENQKDNWQHAAKRIEANKAAFKKADEEYRRFNKKNRGKIKAYSGQEVLTAITEFECSMNNVFGMPGKCVKKDSLQLIKERAIIAIRRDMRRRC